MVRYYLEKQSHNYTLHNGSKINTAWYLIKIDTKKKRVVKREVNDYDFIRKFESITPLEEFIKYQGNSLRSDYKYQAPDCLISKYFDNPLETVAVFRGV